MILLILKEETFFQVLFYFQVYISILSLSLLPHISLKVKVPIFLI